MYVQFCNEAKSCAYWLVNKTLWYGTETRPRHLIFSPRRDRDRDLPMFPRDRDVWKLHLETETSRPTLHPCHTVFGWHCNALSQQMRVELFLPESDKYTAAVCNFLPPSLSGSVQRLDKMFNMSGLLDVSDWSSTAADFSDMMGCITARSPLAWRCGLLWKLLPRNEYVLPQ